MNNWDTLTKLTTAGVLSLALLGCDSSAVTLTGKDAIGVGPVQEDDGVNEKGEVSGLGNRFDTAFPNDGTVGGSIEGFVCTQSTSFNEGSHLEVGANGLIGTVVGGLLNLLSGNALTDLLNSVSDADLAMDLDFKTAAVVTQAVAGFGGALNSLDVTFHLPEETVMDAGKYAVFAVSFPSSLLELGLFSTLTVTTLLDGQVQEGGVSLDTSAASLLGASTNLVGLTKRYALVGLETTKPYDSVRLGVGSHFLTLDLGEKLYIHELCTDGRIVDQAS